MKAFIFLSVCPYMVTGNNPEALIDDVGGVLCFLFGRTAPSLHQTYFSSGVLAECDWWSRDVHFSGWEKGHKRICVHTHHHTTTILSLLFSKCLTWIFPCFYIIKSYFVTCYSSDVLAKKKKSQQRPFVWERWIFFKRNFWHQFCLIVWTQWRGKPGIIKGNIHEYEWWEKKWKLGLQTNRANLITHEIVEFSSMVSFWRLYKWADMKHRACSHRLSTRLLSSERFIWVGSCNFMHVSSCDDQDE